MVWLHPLMAGIGPVTSGVEALATSIAAGILLGGFVTGLVGLLFSWEQGRSDRRVARGGYFGGLIVALVGVAEVGFR
jgi:uncharacterized membrane protein YiaA